MNRCSDPLTEHASETRWWGAPGTRKPSWAGLAGSGARGDEDAWSDIDLVLQLSAPADEPSVVAAWTQWIDQEFGIADTVDVIASGVRYRVFLLPSSLQIDVSFWPADQFRATEPGFALLFGTANEPTAAPPPDIDTTIGVGWLYALHARSAVARGRTWQAVMMLDDLRNQVLTLMCVRLGLNPWHGRDADQLPAEERQALLTSRATDLTHEELERSRTMLNAQFLAEVASHDSQRARRLGAPFDVLARPTR